MSLPEALTLVSMAIGISISIKLLKMVRLIQKANKAYRDALWQIRFCDEGSPVLTYQAMEAIAVKALIENEIEQYTVTMSQIEE